MPLDGLYHAVMTTGSEDERYFGSSVVPGVDVDGWRLGLYTGPDLDSDDPVDAGDAYLVAPDGRRCGIVWSIQQPTFFVILLGDQGDRFGVFEVACEHGPTTTPEARLFVRDLLPHVRPLWEARR